MKDRKDIIQGEKNCPICDKDLSGMRITDVGNHIKWCKFKTNPTNVYSQAMKKSNSKRFGQYNKYMVTCHKCGKQFEVTERQKTFPKKQKYYCSKSCANTRINLKQSWTEEKRNKAREITKSLWLDPEYSKRALTQNKYFTSKGQRMIRDYIVTNHQQDEWTWGSLTKKYKDVMFNPDMFSHKLKIVFEYDGVCHFKDIYKDKDFQAGKRKQKLLQQWCVSNEYKLIRITESWFHSIGSDVTLIQKLLYSIDVPITKLGMEYQV